eukprot:GDKK01066469.1.p1 GENE.GDKK01066469.1~~GDKK01066469.1.p1  ORF type:complete len:119 (+),score=1.14 GDKK01066469.1:198-554(+)
MPCLLSVSLINHTHLAYIIVCISFPFFLSFWMSPASAIVLCVRSHQCVGECTWNLLWIADRNRWSISSSLRNSSPQRLIKLSDEVHCHHWLLSASDPEVNNVAFIVLLLQSKQVDGEH